MPKGMTKRRPETLARLLDAAGEVFAASGFRGASIGEICQRAGYTRGAFYSNFQTRDELFFAVCERHAQQTIQRVADLAAEAGGGELSIRDIAALLARVEPDERAWFLVSTEFALHAMRDPKAGALLARQNDRLARTVGDLVTSLLRSAGVAPPMPPEPLGRAVVAVREGARLQAYVDESALPPGDLDRRMFEILLGRPAAGG